MTERRDGAPVTSQGPVESLRAQVAEVAAGLRGGTGEGPEPTLERPRREEFGDFSTNVAMLLAPALKAPPREPRSGCQGAAPGP